MNLPSKLLDIATGAIEKAMARGATGAECTLSEGDEVSVTVRMSEVETLKEAGSRAAGIRILLGKRVGSSYTSDLTREGIARMLDAAFEIGEITTEDPFAGLPDSKDLGKLDGDLQLYSRTSSPSRRRRRSNWRAGRRLPRWASIRELPIRRAHRSTPSPDATFSPTRWAFPESTAAVTAPSASCQSPRKAP